MGRASSGAHRTDPSSETSTRDARARVWLYVFECYERKKAYVGNTARSGGDAKGERMIAARTAHEAKKEIPPSLTSLACGSCGGSS